MDDPARSLCELPPFALARSRLPELTGKQQRLAAALLTQPEAFAFASIRELGRRFDVDTTAILRFAQTLGCSGYQALQACVRAAYLEQQAGRPDPPPRVAGADALTRAAAGQARHLANLAQAHQAVPAADLEQAASLLAGAARVHVTGESVSAALALLFATLLRHVGVRADVLPASGADRALGLDGVDAADALVAVELWLPFRAVADAVTGAGQRGAATISIAGAPGRATLTLAAPAAGVGLPFSAVAAVAVMELVVAEIASRWPERAGEIERLLHDQYVADGLLSCGWPPAGR